MLCVQRILKHSTQYFAANLHKKHEIAHRMKEKYLCEGGNYSSKKIALIRYFDYFCIRIQEKGPVA